jgi:hypothetical protein
MNTVVAMVRDKKAERDTDATAALIKTRSRVSDNKYKYQVMFKLGTCNIK